MKEIIRNKGFTLLEMLGVLLIISILFVVFLPKLDFAGKLAKETGVKSDFKTFHYAADYYLRRLSAETTLSLVELNASIRTDFQINTTTGETSFKDPFGHPYIVTIEDTDKSITFTSKGYDESTTTDDYVFVVRRSIQTGRIVFHTNGLSSGNIVAIAEPTPEPEPEPYPVPDPTLVTIPDNQVVAFLSKYPSEYYFFYRLMYTNDSDGLTYVEYMVSEIELNYLAFSQTIQPLMNNMEFHRLSLNTTTGSGVESDNYSFTGYVYPGTLSNEMFEDITNSFDGTVIPPYPDAE